MINNNDSLAIFNWLISSDQLDNDLYLHVDTDTVQLLYFLLVYHEANFLLNYRNWQFAINTVLLLCSTFFDLVQLAFTCAKLKL